VCHQGHRGPWQLPRSSARCSPCLLSGVSPSWGLGLPYSGPALLCCLSPLGPPTKAFRPLIAGSATPVPACSMLAIMRAPWWMSMAAVWFGMWAGRISLSSPSTLCLSSFVSLRCSVSCLALSHGRPQSQHVCPAERANVFGVVSQAGTHGLLFGVPKVRSCVRNADRVLLRLRSSCARP
ncbi:Hypothetical protein DHA2_151639, partial [Giardia duodenalis]